MCTSYNWSLTLRIICPLSRCLENDYSSSVQKVVELLILRLELHEKSVIADMKKEKIHVFFVANTIPVTGYVKLYTFHFSACQTYQIVAIHYAQQQHQTASRGMSLICNALMWKIIHKQYALLKVTNTRRAMNCFSLSCGALCLV